VQSISAAKGNTSTSHNLSQSLLSEEARTYDEDVSSAQGSCNQLFVGFAAPSADAHQDDKNCQQPNSQIVVSIPSVMENQQRKTVGPSVNAIQQIDESQNAYVKSIMSSTKIEFRSVAFPGRPDIEELMLRATDLGSYSLTVRYLIDQVRADICNLLETYQLLVDHSYYKQTVTHKITSKGLLQRSSLETDDVTDFAGMEPNAEYELQMQEEKIQEINLLLKQSTFLIESLQGVYVLNKKVRMSIVQIECFLLLCFIFR
jgi:hypothetical protein